MIATPWLSIATPDSVSRRLPDSPIRRVSDYPTRRVWESPTLRLAEFSFKHYKNDSLTRRVGESFSDYEYLCEFEVKIGTARKVVYGIYEEPISAKPQKICLIAMSLYEAILLQESPSRVVAILYARSGEADRWVWGYYFKKRSCYRSHPAERLLNSMLEIARITVGMIISDPVYRNHTAERLLDSVLEVATWQGLQMGW
jgi:hypothetical protein